MCYWSAVGTIVVGVLQASVTATFRLRNCELCITYICKLISIFYPEVIHLLASTDEFQPKENSSLGDQLTKADKQFHLDLSIAVEYNILCECIV